MKRILVISIACLAVLACFSLLIGQRESTSEQQSLYAAWQSFGQGIAELGELIEKAPMNTNPRATAAGYRSMARFLSTIVANTTDYNDPDYPQLIRFPNAVARIGWDNPDNIYLSARLRGDHVYHITGNVGGARFISFNIYSGILGYDAIDDIRRIEGMSTADMEIADDGSFEVILSSEPHPGNWIKLEHDAANVIIRQLYDDWSKPLASMSIVNETTLGLPSPPITPERVAAQLEESLEFTKGLRTLLNWAHRVMFQLKLSPNEVGDPQVASGDLPMSDPFQAQTMAEFELRESEYLVLEVPPTDCLFTNIQLANPWMESLDYASHQSSLNNYTSYQDKDGWTRYVIGANDPGHPNWLDTAGWPKGSLFARWTHCQAYPEGLKSTVVEAPYLADHLPANTPVISSTQRKAAIALRQRNFSRRFGGQ